MRTSTLAVVVPIDTAEKNDTAVREAVWQKTTELLLPELGKLFNRFEPATMAWRQPIGQPYGVIIGRSEPALFLYFYAAAKAEQENAIRFHMSSALDGMDISKKLENGDMVLCSVNLDPSDHETSHHFLWHIAFLAGELLPDSYLYFQQEKQSLASDALHEDTLKHSGRYALCLVKLGLEDSNAN